MSPDSRQLTFLHPQALDLRALASARRLIVFLPDDPLWLLETLQQTALVLESAAMPLPVLILSRCPHGWLWHTLTHLVTNRRLLTEVRAAAADLPTRSIASLLRGHALQAYPPLSQLAEQACFLYGPPGGGLSKPELNAILDLLHGYSIAERAKHRGISQKTLYNQRTTGIKKMAEQYPQLAAHFPGHPPTTSKRAGADALTALEREFVHAIHCHHIFPLFQPIIDTKHRLRGLEILVRWRRDGHILQPGDFLPAISAEYAWLVLTAFVLQEAVRRINQFPGEVYFSVNIPPAIAGHAHLLRMMETARRQLHHPRRAGRLVLEFAETIDCHRNSKIADNIAALRQRGFRVLLDDCFSRGSVMFPVRQVQFNGYKLDKSIIDDMQHDPGALALIKSLHYYCKLTNSCCIAEGVDSEEKLSILKALGIDRFQGYLISPPEEAAKLEQFFGQQEAEASNK
nr:EAL domain-containing protein [Citrobacter rodentium]